MKECMLNNVESQRDRASGTMSAPQAASTDDHMGESKKAPVETAVEIREGEAGFLIGFLGRNFVESWLRLRAVTPKEAALLFFSYSPSKFKNSLPFMGDEFTDEQPFEMVLRHFEDVATDGLQRRLHDWALVAQTLPEQGTSFVGWKACIDIDAELQNELKQPAETKEQRQDRRLKDCEAAGLSFKDYGGRLPDGVGKVADAESVTRQAFSIDVKAALERRASAKREGATVHRA